MIVNDFASAAKLVGIGLVTLLPLMNPLSTVALFLGLSGGMTTEEKNRQISRACLYVLIIMMSAYYAGNLIMYTFGISIPGLRIAGGMIVAFIGFRMLFSQASASDTPEVEAKTNQMRVRRSVDISFVPLAMPVTAGPGTIAMIISGASSLKSDEHQVPFWFSMLVGPPVVFVLCVLIVWICLRSAEPIMNRVGKGAIEAVSRLMGFLLVCMGVQFVINGVLEIVHDEAALEVPARQKVLERLSPTSFIGDYHDLARLRVGQHTTWS